MKRRSRHVQTVSFGLSSFLRSFRFPASFPFLVILRPSFEGAAAALLLLRMLIHAALAVLRMLLHRALLLLRMRFHAALAVLRLRFHAALAVLRLRFHAALPLRILAEGIECAGAALARVDNVINVISNLRFFSVGI